MKLEDLSILKTYTDQSLISIDHRGYSIVVYWKLTINEEKFGSLFGTLKEPVDSTSVSTGVGSMTIRLGDCIDGSFEYIMALSEAFTCLFVTHNLGFNAFGLSDKQGVPIGGLRCELSQDLSIGHINRKTVNIYNQSLSFSFEPVKAFLFGSKFVKSDSSTWVYPYLVGEVKCDYCKEYDIERLSQLAAIRTKWGTVHITSITVEEFLNIPLNKEIIDIKGLHSLRFPYAFIKNNLTSPSTYCLPATHNHSIRLKEKFGSAISASHNGLIMDLVLLEEEGNQYSIYGFRQYYSPRVYERLREGGYLHTV